MQNSLDDFYFYVCWIIITRVPVVVFYGLRDFTVSNILGGIASLGYIASYSFLTCIIAKITRYKPGKLIHILGDTHIYDSHIEAVRTQIKRIPYKFPTLTISEELNDIDDINEDYFKLDNYNYHDKINAPMIA